MSYPARIVRPFGQGELPLYAHGKGIVVEPWPGRRIVKVGVHPLLHPFSCVESIPNPDVDEVRVCTEAFDRKIDCGNDLIESASIYFKRNAGDSAIGRELERFASEGRKGKIVQDILGQEVMKTDPTFFNYVHPALATDDEMREHFVIGGFYWFSIGLGGVPRLFFGGNSMKFGKVRYLGAILREALAGTRYGHGEISGA